jgi:hypothetical protein
VARSAERRDCDGVVAIRVAAAGVEQQQEEVGGGAKRGSGSHRGDGPAGWREHT